jgi:uridine kinase
VRAAVARGKARGRRPPFAVVAIGGTAATGKTTLARRLAELGDVPARVLSTDGYMMERPERRVRRITGPNPAANDLARLSRDLERVARGEATTILVRKETPEGRKSVEEPFEPAALVLIEGLVALYPEVATPYDFAIFLDGPPDDEFAVRLDRDVKERAHPRDEVEEYHGLRQTEYDRWLRPTAKRADVRLWADRPGGLYRLAVVEGS